MGRRFRILLISCLTILVSVCLITAGTFALFTDKVTLVNHLEAGTLDIGLKRTSLTYTGLDENGYPKTGTAGEMSLSDPTTNAFGLTENTKIAPMSSYTADFEIFSKGSVAFGWWIEVIVKYDTEDEKSVALAEQLYISVSVKDGNSDEQAAKNGITLGSDTAFLGRLGVNDLAQEFTVKFYFKNYSDEETNNKAQGGKLSFDMVVHANQLTA